MANNSDGLFEIVCQCDNRYLAELRKCNSCDKDTRFQKELHFNYQEFFNRIYSSERVDAIDLVFEVFDHLYNRFDIKNKILTDIDLSKLKGGIIVSLMTNCFAFKHKLPDFVDFCNRAASQLRISGTPEDEIEEYMRDFRDCDVQKHWKDMAAFGFPNGILGPGPGDLNGV